MSSETNPDQCLEDDSVDREGWEELAVPDRALPSHGSPNEERDHIQRPEPNEKSVYEALKTMPVLRKFPKTCSKSRLVKAIGKRRHFENVDLLFREFDAEAIYSTALRVYKCRAFTDEEVAAKMFPDYGKDPVYLHSLAQMPLVTILKKGVTYACYAYVNEQEPSLLRDRGWNQAESANLEQLLDATRTIKDASTSMTPDQTRLFELMGDLARAAGTEWKDASKLAETLKATESFASLLGNRNGQTVITLLRSGTEAELAELAKKGHAHQAKVREGISRIAIERVKLDQEEENLVKALQDQESIFAKAATLGVIRGVRIAEDALVNEFFCV
jgi:hypothetical protein